MQNARNHFRGKIVRIDEGPVCGTVVLDIGGGDRVTSVLSMSAIRELDLSVDKEAFADIRTMSVVIGVEDWQARAG